MNIFKALMEYFKFLKRHWREGCPPRLDEL
jgi:hypothetical protein